MKSVIIIGGGIAGLSAAWELIQSGLSVTIVETKSRWGGRIHTIGDSTPIELGAEFVHGRSPALLGLISDAGLTTRRASDEIKVFENGAVKQVRFWDKIEEVFGRIDSQQPDTTFTRILEMPGLDSCARTWARGYVEGFNAADSARISGHSVLRLTYSAEQMDGSWQARIEQGYGALIKFLVKQLNSANGNLLLDTTVNHVDWRPSKVEVSATRRGKNLNLEADAAVLTLPLGVLKAEKISFRPGLGEKMEAIQQLEFGNVVKLIIEFRERWWDQFFGFLHAFDQPFPTWWQNSNAVLTSWAGGPKADKLVPLEKEQLLSTALNSLGNIFPVSAGSLQEKVKSCHYHNWAGDPNVRGTYSYIPVNGLDLPKLLAEPIHETLFFAGEATISDAQTGTTFGALESGLRAASEVLGKQA